MSNSIDALNLPIQLFAVGTVIGMTAALIHHALSDELERWPIFVAIPSVALFFLGVLQTVVRALC